jgi:hypothetical protein
MEEKEKRVFHDFNGKWNLIKMINSLIATNNVFLTYQSLWKVDQNPIKTLARNSSKNLKSN